MSGNYFSLTPEQIDQYDALLCRHSEGIEAASLESLAFTIAHVEQGPPQMIESLARHDDILIAGPILAHSPILHENLLLEIVESRPQPHLRAVCERSSVSRALTEALLKAGDAGTVRHLMKNPKAQFGDVGFTVVVASALNDEALALRLVARGDVPARHLKALLEQAPEDLRAKLIESNPKITAALKADTLDAGAAGEEPSSDRGAEFAAAREQVTALYRAGELDDASLVGFAESGKADETLVGLALLCRIEPNAARRAAGNSGIDTVLMMAKICDLTWPDAKTVLGALKQGVTASELEKAMGQYARLKPDMARGVLQIRLQPKPTNVFASLGLSSEAPDTAA